MSKRDMPVDPDRVPIDGFTGAPPDLRPVDVAMCSDFSQSNIRHSLFILCTGDFRFLAPDFACKVYAPGEAGSEFGTQPYPSVEHAFQASKCNGEAARAAVREAKTARDAKKLGSAAQKRAGAAEVEAWRKGSAALMEALVRDKFVRNRELRDKLLETKERPLKHNNSYNDTHWGVGPDGRGANELGKLIDRVRADCRANPATDALNWAQAAFPPTRKPKEAVEVRREPV